MLILVIDDDTELCQLLAEFLRREGYDVRAAHTAATGVQSAQELNPSLIILDVMLPDADGFSVLRRVRQSMQTPVLMLTARGEDIDRIVGLELGADDYMPKPFNPRELAARIKAILRRTQAVPDETSLSVNGVNLNPATREVKVDGQPVSLTTTEFDILQVLLKNAGRVLSRDDLMEHLYQRKASPFDRAIDVHIGHLRRKLELGRPLIKTIRGVGYQFVRSSTGDE
ncbi:MAG: response regulator transcription factor [Bryobacterales bacterium]|nr:response regulator transcription factor [Bryobacterales bacterium]